MTTSESLPQDGLFICAGEAGADLLFSSPPEPDPGQLVRGNWWKYCTGGQAANVAIWLRSVFRADRGNEAALTQNSHWLVAKVGEDSAGAMLKRALLKHGVDRTLFLDVTASTQLSCIRVCQLPRTATTCDAEVAGERAIIDMPGASSLLTASEVQRAVRRILNECELSSSCSKSIFIGALGMLDAFEQSSDVVEMLLWLKRKDFTIYADAAGDRSVHNRDSRKQLARLLAHVDYFLPSEVEAYSLIDETRDFESDQRIERLRWLGQMLREQYKCANIIIKAKSRGAYIVNDGKGTIVPVGKIDVSPKDATGAGDAWVAGFIAAKSRHACTVNAVCIGHELARICLQNTGATGGSMKQGTSYEFLCRSARANVAWREEDQAK